MLQVYSLPKCDLVQEKSQLNEIVWSTWTSVLGPEMAGVWPAQAKTADVNCADVNKAGNAVITGDDFGFVKLFPFPAFKTNVSTLIPLIFRNSIYVILTNLCHLLLLCIQMPHKAYVGHSAHVTNTSFSHDDSLCVSTGGEDACIFVWRTKP